MEPEVPMAQGSGLKGVDGSPKHPESTLTRASARSGCQEAIQALSLEP